MKTSCKNYAHTINNDLPIKPIEEVIGDTINRISVGHNLPIHSSQTAQNTISWLRNYYWRGAISVIPKIKLYVGIIKSQIGVPATGNAVFDNMPHCLRQRTQNKTACA